MKAKEYESRLMKAGVGSKDYWDTISEASHDNEITYAELVKVLEKVQMDYAE